MSSFPIQHIVTCFLQYNGKILLLKRSQLVGSFQGKWAGISGYLESTSPDQQVLIEIKEETSLSSDDVFLIKKGIIFEVDDHKHNVHWIIHPYMYQVVDPSKIKTDWEHCDMRWISPSDINSMETVTGLAELLSQFINIE
jgi:8-oxo-dGTP pyrophosphatase MutT (NUDIX family)